jgi:hypothetical protein
VINEDDVEDHENEKSDDVIQMSSFPKKIFKVEKFSANRCKTIDKEEKTTNELSVPSSSDKIKFVTPLAHLALTAPP